MYLLLLVGCHEVVHGPRYDPWKIGNIVNQESYVKSRSENSVTPQVIKCVSVISKESV